MSSFSIIIERQCKAVDIMLRTIRRTLMGHTMYMYMYSHYLVLGARKVYLASEILLIRAYMYLCFSIHVHVHVDKINTPVLEVMPVDLLKLEY